MTRLDDRPVAARRTLLAGLVRTHALGAVSGQLSQALASFVLQLIAARLLGASGLGLFALVYSVLVMASAVSTGLIGDSLTILDRHDARIRSGLQRWGLLTGIVSGVTGAVAAGWTHTLDPVGAVLFGAAMAAFLLEDALRRLLMASMRFWSLVIVDITGLAVSLATLVTSAVFGTIDINTFLLALLLGQVAAGICAIPLLPAGERRLAPWRPAATALVGRFGFWRGAQQGIRPTMLTVARILITLAVGRAAFGELEASRVYMAPAMLVVQGLGTYLLSWFARRQEVPLSVLLRRADIASGLMFGVAVLMGLVATFLAPVLGPVITGGGYVLAPLAVFGWAIYAASSAAVMPFASLAAVRGRQSLVVGLRTADSVLSLAALALVLFPMHGLVDWAPIALAAGSFVGAWFIRVRVIKPLVRVSSS